MNIRHGAIALCALLCPTAAQATAAIEITLDAAARADLPRTHVQAQAHGQTLSCDGVRLADLLRKAGALPDGKLPGALLDHYVLITARDGYRVVYSLAELDPGTGNRAVHLVDRCDEKPLSAQDGPLRLVTPDERRPARWVRQVEKILVVDPD